jgi:hypothetical protein
MGPSKRQEKIQAALNHLAREAGLGLSKEASGQLARELLVFLIEKGAFWNNLEKTREREIAKEFFERMAVKKISFNPEKVLSVISSYAKMQSIAKEKRIHRRQTFQARVTAKPTRNNYFKRGRK